MKGITVVDGGDSGTHELTAGVRKMIYRGFSFGGESAGTAIQLDVIVRNKDAAGQIIRVHAKTGEVNKKLDYHETLETEGVEVEEGLYIEIVVANAVAGSINASLLFDEGVP